MAAAAVQHSSSSRTSGSRLPRAVQVGSFAARRQRAAERAAAAAGSLGKEVKEADAATKSLQDENKYLVNNLVDQDGAG